MKKIVLVTKTFSIIDQGTLKGGNILLKPETKARFVVTQENLSPFDMQAMVLAKNFNKLRLLVMGISL